MQSRHHQNVKYARLLEIHRFITIYEAAISQQHGAEDSCSLR